MHQRNAAERAIRTFKNHFLAGLATCDPDFPLQEWDRLILQATITVNLLCSSRVNPKLSAYAYVFGPFDFNRTPLAPPGTKVIIHNKANIRASWGYHGTKGWYVGPSLEHYRCLKCYNPDSMKEVDTDTLELLQHSIPLPVFTNAEAIEQAVQDLIRILKNPQKNNIPRVLVGDKIRNAFQEVAKILQRDNPNLPQTRINNSTQQSTTEIANPKKLCSSTQSAPKLQQ